MISFMMRTMSSEHLPEEILVKILCKLPPKSLSRFLCVCKSWCSLITSPYFISLHRRHCRNFLLLQLYRGILSGADDVSVPLTLPSFSHRDSAVNDICHGLLCITTFDSNDGNFSFIICNPSLRRFLPIPKPNPLCLPKHYLFINSNLISSIAFGFDSRNCDYKIVRVVSTGNEYRHNPCFGVHVFSLASKVWRTVPVPPHVCIPDTLSGPKRRFGPWVGRSFVPHGFVKDLVHWGARRRVDLENKNREYYLFVLSFDFVDEVFDEVSLPESIARSSEMTALVTVIGGCNEKPLTVYHTTCYFDTGSIWVMKEYGVVESWNKLFSFDLTVSGLQAPSLGITVTGVTILPQTLCLTENGEILLLLYHEQRNECLYLLDVEKTTFVELPFGANGDFWRGPLASYYAESLVLLNNADAGAMISY